MKYVRIIFGRKGGEVATLILVAILFYLFVGRGLRFFRVPSSSMEPTLFPMDYIVTMDEKTYDRGDIVVLRDPEEKGGYIVKRIVAVGGDTVSASGGAVYLSGHYISEPYVKAPGTYRLHRTEVPEGKAFLLGDNRDNSEDSHLWEQKAQPVANIIGRVRFIYYPYDRFGPLRRHAPVSTFATRPFGV